MLSFRSVARLAPRAISRLTSTAIRRPIPRPSSVLQSAWKPAPSRFAAAFSTSNARWSAAAEGDAELVDKLKSEIEFETKMIEEDGSPASVQEYLANSPFEIIDTAGQEEVVLTRKFGDESIRVSFSIADLNNLDPESDYQDQALGDEEDNINQGDEKNFKIAPEDSVEEGTEGEELQHDQSFPVRLNVIVEKAGKGALSIETVVQDGLVQIQNIYQYKDASLAHAKTAEKVHERDNLYVGPPFENLDEELQVNFERFLEERGINTALAVFVPDYIEMKEQNEYLRWLSNVKSFVEP